MPPILFEALKNYYFKSRSIRFWVNRLVENATHFEPPGDFRLVKTGQ